MKTVSYRANRRRELFYRSNKTMAAGTWQRSGSGNFCSFINIIGIEKTVLIDQCMFVQEIIQETA